MARHKVFIVKSDITPGQEKTLRDRLHALPKDSFKTFPMVHFASFMILEKEDTGLNPMLVMECNIDGSAKAFFRMLAGSKSPDVDRIFECCGNYPKGDRDATVEFFENCRKKPRLYHVGAPWRSVASIKSDHKLRRRLADRLGATMNGSLMTDIVVPPAGQQEYWTWEILEPWAALLLGFGGPGLAFWFSRMTARSPAFSGWAFSEWAIIGFTAFYAALALKSILGALALWRHALPELRDGVRPWIWWIPAAAAGLALARWLRRSHPDWALAVLAALALAFIYNILAAIRRRSNERLAAIRVNADGRTIAEIWEELKSERVTYRSETDWPQRLWFWSSWLIAFVIVAVPLWLLRQRPWGVIALVGVLFCLKAVWLAVLSGWPSKAGKGDLARIRLFIVLAALAAGAGSGLVMVVAWPPWFGPTLKACLLAILVLAGLFALWAMPLPSPPVERPTRSKRLDEVTSQEDCGVQNHMSAVVVLKQDRWYRVPALKAFLFLLNRLFYRCWAPDLYRGKLFGVPTVHFAQWVLLDERNYLFLSNYDNSWTTYLDDFGETLAAGLQKVWGQGDKNPGIKDVARFKEYARSTMVPYEHWYSAYPDVTIRQVWNNREIRRGLARATKKKR